MYSLQQQLRITKGQRSDGFSLTSLPQRCFKVRDEFMAVTIHHVAEVLQKAVPDSVVNQPGLSSAF